MRCPFLWKYNMWFQNCCDARNQQQNEYSSSDGHGFWVLDSTIKNWNFEQFFTLFWFPKCSIFFGVFTTVKFNPFITIIFGFFKDLDHHYYVFYELIYVICCAAAIILLPEKSKGVLCPKKPDDGCFIYTILIFLRSNWYYCKSKIF